jgi:hypothetical protein
MSEQDRCSPGVRAQGEAAMADDREPTADGGETAAAGRRADPGEALLERFTDGVDVSATREEASSREMERSWRTYRASAGA